MSNEQIRDVAFQAIDFVKRGLHDKAQEILDELPNDWPRKLTPTDREKLKEAWNTN